MTNCTRCDGTGFLNLHQIPSHEIDKTVRRIVLHWIKVKSDHDVQVCDCCGDSEAWHGVPGQHYGIDDPQGDHGPYAYNGGLCECH